MADQPKSDTWTGNRGLMIEEPLIFEQDMPGRCGVDLPAPATVQGPSGRPARARAPSACPVWPNRRRSATTRASAKRTTPSTRASIRSAPAP